MNKMKRVRVLVGEREEVAPMNRPMKNDQETPAARRSEAESESESE